MARKKAEPNIPDVDFVRVTVLVAFNGMYAGDSSVVELPNETVVGWERAGLVRLERLFDDGARSTGQSTAQQDDPGSLAFGAGDSGASGDEPSQGFGAGGYGTAEG